MHHPGPPRFTAVGETVELAPRDPDPDATYHWRVADAPTRSTATLGDGPVLDFSPDVAGVYTVALDAPDATHDLTIRAFSAETAVAGEQAPAAYSGPRHGDEERADRNAPADEHGSGGVDVGDTDEGRPRVQLTGECNGDTVTLTASARSDPDRQRDDPRLDVEFYVDDRDDAPSGLTTAEREATVPLTDLDTPVRIHAVAVGEQYSVADAVRVHPDGTVERLNDPPDWGTEMTLYEIYVRGYKDAGGDRSVFAAIRDDLDEIEALGVNTLWLTPILGNDHADHGYNITDFYSIADDLGTEAEFAALVEAAHDRGMKVLFDLVLNHSARTHPYFERAKAGEQPYRDYYEWNDDGSPGTYFDWEHIANFDFDTLAVRRYLLDAVDKWAEYVDGFRCDMAWAVPKPFWQEIRERVRSKHPDFVLLDETVPYVADFHELAFDIHFDTTLYFTLRQIGRGHAPASDVLEAIRQRATTGFPDHAGFMLYVENHDETRYVEECGRDAVEAAAAAQFTLPGVPMIYAGQEIGERNRRGHIYWEHARDDLREYYRRLARTRNETPALGYHGEYEPVAVEGGGDRTVAFAREAEARYVVVLHFGAGETTVSVPGESVDPYDVVTGEAVDAPDGDSVVENVVVLPAGDAP